MSLTRRGVMGAALGGAAAAAMPDMGEASGCRGVPLNDGLYAMAEKEAAQRQYDLERLARLKRHAAGDIADHEKDYPEIGMVEPFDTLRSVSPAAKRVMTRDHYRRRWHERTIEKAKLLLAEYDKTGILREFF